VPEPPPPRKEVIKITVRSNSLFGHVPPEELEKAIDEAMKRL